MTMHLVRGMSTTSTKKHKAHLNKAEIKARDKAQQELNKTLVKVGLDPHRDIDPNNFKGYFGQYTGSNTTKTEPIKKQQLTQMKDGGLKKNEAPKVYSGKQKLLGIAVMHKSNLVPVFDIKDAEDIAKMRRG